MDRAAVAGMTYSRRHRKARGVGRPPLASTRWLAEQLRNGADPPTLFLEWQTRHEACSGYRCADPARSFRAALRVAERTTA